MTQQSKSTKSKSKAAGLPRVAWLLIVLVAGVVIVLPARRWFAAYSAGPVAEVVDEEIHEPIALPDQPLELSVDELRAEAEQVSSILLDAHSDSASALHIVAGQYSRLRQYEKAAELWEKAIELAPQYAGPRAGLAMTAMEQGQNEQAVRLLEEALAAKCESPEIYRELAFALQKAGVMDRAEQICREGIARYPDEIGLWIAQGQLQLQLQQLTEAKDSFEQALKRQPGAGGAHFALATVYARLRDTAKSQQHRRRHEAIRASRPQSQHRFQVVYHAVLRQIVVATMTHAAGEFTNHEDVDTAESLYLRALQIKPNEADACRGLTSLLRRQGRAEEALMVQQRLLELEPRAVENYVNLASLATQVGRDDLAERSLQTALQFAPQSAVVHQSLAILCLTRSQPEQARLHATELVRLQPTSTNYLLLGQICQQMGDTAGASAAQRAAEQMAVQE